MRFPAIAFVTLIGSPAAASEYLEPSGKWVIDYAEAQCLATRPFGSGSSAFYLLLKPSPTSDVMQMAVIKDGQRAAGVQRDGAVRFGEAQPTKIKFLEYGTSEKKSVRSVNLSPELVVQLSRAPTTELRVGSSVTRIDTGPMAAVIKVLENCRDDLRTYWNIVPAKRDALKAPARSVVPIYSLFNSDDYPAQAVSSHESGATSVVALVDEQGVVRDCMVDATSGIATLDAMTCIVIRKRGKFEPAIGADGKPSRGSFTQRVRWELPRN